MMPETTGQVLKTGQSSPARGICGVRGDHLTCLVTRTGDYDNSEPVDETMFMSEGAQLHKFERPSRDM